MGRAASSQQRIEPGDRSSQKIERRSQKARALWAMKAAWDRGENVMIQLAKKIFFCRTTNRLEMWEEHLKDPMAALAKSAGMFGKSILWLAFGFAVCCCQPL